MLGTYPLSIRNDRILPESYRGTAYVWDIDKTYLSTRFSSWRGMAMIPVEFAVDKEAIPGMPEILRGLRRGPEKRVECRPLYFVSASPPFLRGVIEEKMLRDGVEQDGIIFKDWLRTVLQLRPYRLFDQVGFKTSALLRGRMDRVNCEEYLFGDDYESDAEAFALYARWINGDLRASGLEAELSKAAVKPFDIKLILRAAEAVPESRGTVQKIFIHLEKRTPPENFKRYGEILVAVRGAYQLALVLHEAGLIDAATLHAAEAAVHAKGTLSSELFADAIQRKLISKNKTALKASRRKEDSKEKKGKKKTVRNRGRF